MRSKECVATDATVTGQPAPASQGRMGGFTGVVVYSDDKALVLATKSAVAGRCKHEVREFVPSPVPYLAPRPARSRSQDPSVSIDDLGTGCPALAQLHRRSPK
jgi:hypothetical protein